MGKLGPQLVRIRKLVRVAKVPRYRRALRHGVAAAVEHEAIPLRPDFDTVIDVGANRGQFAIFAAHRFPGARLICFEPLPGPRAKLKRVTACTGQLRVFDVAVADSNRAADFHVSAADDSSSLFPIGQRQREAFPGTEELETIKVNVRRLDELLGPSDLVGRVLLKIDAQGGELDALRGAQDLLDSVDTILVESSFTELYTGQPLADEVCDFLRTRGYGCVGVWSVIYGRGGNCIQADFVFARAGFDPLVMVRPRS